MKAELILLANNLCHGMLPLDQKTISQLLLKHLQKRCASEDILINGPLEKFHLV